VPTADLHVSRHHPLAQDPRTGDYLAYHKRHWDYRGFNRRTVWLSRSRDFQTWSEPSSSSRPMRRTTVGERSETADGGLRHEPSCRMRPVSSFPTMFRLTRLIPEKELKPEQSGADGHIDVQLVTSPDGENWHRTTPAPW
jgi:hypothetical protein